MKVISLFALLLIPCVCFSGLLNPEGFDWGKPHLLKDQDGNEYTVTFSEEMVFVTEARLNVRLATGEIITSISPLKYNYTFEFKTIPNLTSETEFYFTELARKSSTLPTLLAIAYSLTFYHSSTGYFRKQDISPENRTEQSRIKLLCQPGQSFIDISWIHPDSGSTLTYPNSLITVTEQPGCGESEVKFKISYLKKQERQEKVYTLNASTLTSRLDNFAQTHLQKENTCDPAVPANPYYHLLSELPDNLEDFCLVTPQITAEQALAELGETDLHTADFVDPLKQLENSLQQPAPGSAAVDDTPGITEMVASEALTAALTEKEHAGFEQRRLANTRVHALNKLHASHDPKAEELKKKAFNARATTRQGELFEKIDSLIGIACGGDAGAQHSLAELNRSRGPCTLAKLRERNKLESQAGGRSMVKKHRKNTAQIAHTGNITSLESISADGTQVIKRDGFTTNEKGMRVGAAETMAEDTYKHSYEAPLPPGQKKGFAVTFLLGGSTMDAVSEMLEEPSELRKAALTRLEKQALIHSPPSAGSESAQTKSPSIFDQLKNLRQQITLMGDPSNLTLPDRKKLRQLESTVTRLNKQLPKKK